MNARSRLPSAAVASRMNFKSLIQDFRNLNPNDPGAWPGAPRVVVLLFLLAAILTAGWWFLWSEELTQLEIRREEEARLKGEYLNKKRQAVNLDLYTQQLAEIDRSFGALLKQLPNKSEMGSLLIEVNQAGLGRGLQFELFRPGQEEVKDFYAELSIAVKVQGNYHDLGAFAADIAKLPRIVTLNNLVIAAAPGGLLTLDAVIKTFRYLDEEEMARRRKAAPGIKK